MRSRTEVRVWVPGRPSPQGSKRPVGRRRNGSTILIESSKQLKPWRESVRDLLLIAAPGTVLAGAVRAELSFVLPRPKRLAGRPTPPHLGKPDLDKLIRGVCDAITFAGTWADDSAVTEVIGRKRYAEDSEGPGVLIELSCDLATQGCT